MGVAGLMHRAAVRAAVVPPGSFEGGAGKVRRGVSGVHREAGDGKTGHTLAHPSTFSRPGGVMMMMMSLKMMMIMMMMMMMMIYDARQL